MIQELINFMTNLQQDNPDVMQWKEMPSEGLHIFIDLDKDGKWSNQDLEIGKDYEYFDGINKELKLWNDCLRYQNASDYITMNKVKRFDSKQKIHSCSPFTVAFNFKLNDKDKGKYKISKLIKSATKEEKEENMNLIREVKCQMILERIEEYKKNSQMIYFENEPSEEKETSTSFLNLAPSFLKNVKNLQEFKLLSESDYIRFYLRTLNIECQEQLYQKYYKDNLFNVDKYTKKIDNVGYGVAGFMTSFTDKKPFLKHFTSPFEKGINIRISREDALILDDFGKLVKRKALPYPLPIFIDKKEFYDDKDVVSLFQQGGEYPSYSNVLKRVFEKNPNTVLSNYYLLNLIQTKDGLVVKDFDFVTLFRYQINCKIKNYTELGDLSNYPLDNIFALEKELSNFFVKYDNKKKQGWGFLIGNYFSDKIEKQKGYDVKPETQQIMYKYRKAVYDFIYKSKTDALSVQMLDDIAVNSIIVDMNMDEIVNGNHSRYASIRKKINVWFSLYNSNLFTNNTNRQDMSTLIERHQKMMQEFSEEKGRIENDSDYGFAVGQVIYYILSKSKSSDKSYAKLVPFMQKTSRVELNKAILRIFETYAHENFSNKFKYVFGLIMEFDKDVKVKEIMPNILGGFFLPNMLFSDSK